jgi:tetratricopeptide (TPR) repeat protein
MEPLASMMLGAGQNLQEPAPEAGAEYDFPLFKAFASARRFAAAMSQTKVGARQASAVPVLAPLPETPSDTKAKRDWIRCQSLLDRCRALRHNDPETLVLTATLTAALAERLDPGPFGTAALADLQARAWAERGNARRVADDLTGAESDLAHALELSGQGTEDPSLLASLMDLTASLYTDQRRFDEALQLLDAVYAIYQRQGDMHSAGRALISKGASIGYASDPEEELRLLNQGLGLIDASRDPKLAMVGIHNLIWCLVECGRAAQAEQLFAYSRELFSTYVERLDAVKSLWLEGRIAAALGSDELAERRFWEVRASFEALKLPYDVGLVSLDMAALWLQAGRTAEIKGLIDETISIFRARKIRREAIGMLLLVREAFQKDQATEKLLRTVAAELLWIEDIPARRGRVSG